MSVLAPTACTVGTFFGTFYLVGELVHLGGNRVIVGLFTRCFESVGTIYEDLFSCFHVDKRTDSQIAISVFCLRFYPVI